MNGKYLFSKMEIIISLGFEWGFLGHPWEETITIFGKGLFNSFEKH